MIEGVVARPLPLSHDPWTPADVIKRIRQLYAAAQSYEEIAEQLNREGLRTARNMTFTAGRVDHLIRSRKINKERTH